MSKKLYRFPCSRGAGTRRIAGIWCLLGCFAILAVGCAAPTTDAVDEDGLREEVYQGLLDQLSGRTVGVSNDRRTWVAESRVGKDFLDQYRKTPPPVVLAGCIDWSSPAPRLEFTQFRYGGLSIATNKERAIRGCRNAKAQRGRYCSCQIIEVNQRNRLELPPDFVRNYEAGSFPKAQINLPLIVSWEGISGRMAAAIYFIDDGTPERMSLEFPRTNDTCNGEFIYTNGSYRKVYYPRGTWNLSCSNGLAASGTFTSGGPPYSGAASGKDSRGRLVILTWSRYYGP